MERSLRRRSFLAAVGAVGLAGCTALGDSESSGDGLEGDDDRDDQEESGAAIEVHGSEITDEQRLTQITARGATEFESIRYVDGDNLKEIEPERERFVQIFLSIDDLRETDIGEEFELPPIEDLELAVVETGDVLEPITLEEFGIRFRDTREDHRLSRLEDPHETVQGGKTWRAPLVDAPTGRLAVDVAPILERDERIWLRPG